jgi:hypothetical protein
MKQKRKYSGKEINLSLLKKKKQIEKLKADNKKTINKFQKKKEN